MNKFSKKISFLIVGVLLALPSISYAQITSASSLLVFITSFINATIPVLISIAVLFFIWGVVQYVASGDDAELRKKSRNKIIWGIVSIAIILSAWGLVNIITNSLGLSTTSQVPQIQTTTTGSTTIVPITASTPIVICGVGGAARCKFCDLWRLARSIIDFLMIAVIPLVGIGIAVGGFMMLASFGSESKYSRGKEIIGSAILGLIIALMAWLIINTIIQFIANPTAFPFGGSWFGIPSCP